LFKHKKDKLFLISADDALFVDENGQTIDYQMCHDLYDEYKNWNLEAKAIWETKKIPNSELISYTDFMKYKLDIHINEKNDSEEVKKLKRAVLEQMLKQETAESGCSIMDLCSLKEYGSYVVPTGPDYEFPGGFSKLIEYLAKDLPQSCIQLNCPVRRISLHKEDEEDDACVRPTRLMVECENGVYYRANHVVVTCSVNYLQKNYTKLFDSRLLNDKKIEAINTVQMSTVDKIFLFYEDMSFFPQNIDALKPIFLDEPQNGDMKENWIYKIYTFDKFHSNLLLVWLTGEEANYVEGLNEGDIADTLTNLLKKLLKNDNVPKPKKLMM
jgi:hypothetical protein